MMTEQEWDRLERIARLLAQPDPRRRRESKIRSLYPKLDIVAELVSQRVQMFDCWNAVVLVRDLKVRQQSNLLAKGEP